MFGMDLKILLPMAKKTLKEENCKSFIFALDENNSEGFVFEKKKYNVFDFCKICEKMIQENEKFKSEFIKISQNGK